MSLFRQHAAPCAFPADESWVILSPIEASIKRKIEAVGTPLSVTKRNANALPPSFDPFFAAEILNDMVMSGRSCG